MKKILILGFYIFFSTALIAQGTQTIKGQVIDEASKVPLPGVLILVVNSNPQITAVTDANGNFKLQNVPLGRHNIKISFTGYADKTLFDIIVTAGKEVVLNLSIEEKISQLDEISVIYDKSKDKNITNNDMSTVSARSFNIDETKRYAGALGDPSRMAANFAGVVAGNDSRNDIVVRGNSPNGMLWQLEGINIPNPNHFGALNSTGGPVSMLNNNNLDKSDFMTSAFPAQYGNAVAGVFDLRLRNGNRDKHEFLGQVGFNGFEAGAEGPLGKKGGASYLLNYRYSTLGVFQKMGINFGTGSATPLYEDINYKIFVPLGSRGKLSVFGIAGKSKVDFLGNETDTTQGNLYSERYQNTRVKYATNITGISYEHILASKTTLKTTLGYSSTKEYFAGDSISYITLQEFPSGQAQFYTEKYSATLSLYHKFNARNSLVIGGIADYTWFSLMNKRFYGGITELIRVNENGNTLLSQAFAQWKHRFTDKFSFVSGLHFQHLDLSNSVAIEPRVGLRYKLNDKHTLNLGYGVHGQMQSIYTYFVQTHINNQVFYTNKNLDFTKSHHVVLSYDWNINNHLRLRSEVYRQWLYNAPVERTFSSFSVLNTGADFTPSNADSLVNKGTGRNYGVEFTLERFFNKNYYFLITLSLFDSKYKGSDGIERNTAFNTQRVLNVLGGKEFKLGKKQQVLAINTKVSWSGGRYLTPLDEQLSGIYATAIYHEDKAYSEKQSDYFRIDVKIAYRKEFKKSTMEFSIDLQNLTNHQNIFRQSYNPQLNKIITEYQQGFFPVPMFRWTF